MRHTLPDNSFVRCENSEQMKDLVDFVRANRNYIQISPNLDEDSFLSKPNLIYYDGRFLINVSSDFIESVKIAELTPEQFKNHCLGL